MSTQAYCSFLLLFSKSVRSLGVGACAEVHEVYRLLNGSQSGEGGWEFSMVLIRTPVLSGITGVPGKMLSRMMGRRVVADLSGTMYRAYNCRVV